MSKPSPKRQITYEEAAAIRCIAHVGMPSASWDKRFRRDVLAQAMDTGLISDKAAAQLWRIFIRYRGQIPADAKALFMRYAKARASA